MLQIGNSFEYQSPQNTSLYIVHTPPSPPLWERWGLEVGGGGGGFELCKDKYFEKIEENGGWIFLLEKGWRGG